MYQSLHSYNLAVFLVNQRKCQLGDCGEETKWLIHQNISFLAQFF